MSKVYLVGAGPGDPELITVRGRELLSQADCVVYDRLAAPELLGYVRGDCELIYVGKESGRHTLGQSEINALLVERAREKDLVVRLKGGDPFVFGRGGEEILALIEHGVDFEVVPGVSSATAGVAAAGIPATHRGIAGGFHVVTAHDRRNRLADIDFAAMARGSDTCIFLMGLGVLGEIAERLAEAGMPADMDAIVISRATMPGQKVCQGTVGTIAELAQRSGIVSPALLVVGRVVALRKHFAPSGEAEREKRRFLIPKIGREPSLLAKLLRGRGIGASEIQVGEIEFFSWLSEDFSRTVPDWLFFTSRNGVRGFFYGLREAGSDIRLFSSCKIAAVGEKTAKELAAHGLRADFIPGRADSAHLAREWRERERSGQTIWYMRAENADSRLAAELSRECEVTEVNVYRNREIKPRILPDFSYYDGILFTSGLLAERLLGACRENRGESGEGDGCRRGYMGSGSSNEDIFSDCVVFSIGPRCTETLKRLGCRRICQAEAATYESLVKSVLFF